MEPLVNQKNIEKTFLQMLPRHKQIIIDEWVLNFYDRLIKRLNFVAPLSKRRKNLQKKIQLCERIFNHKHFDYSFRLTSFYNNEFDDLLANHAYKKIFINKMFTINITNNVLSTPVIKSTEKANLSEWILSREDISGCHSNESKLIMNCFNAIPLPKCLMTIEKNNKNISCGIGILYNNYLGIFDVKTLTDFQNKGFGTSIIQNMLLWAKKQGANNAILYVNIENNNAINFYKNLGFQECYKFWLRYKSSIK